MSNPLLDKDFLLKLDQQKERENFARIISLDFDENPLEQIEGRVTGGSVNIDGTSAVRRSCSLSMENPVALAISPPRLFLNTCSMPLGKVKRFAVSRKLSFAGM